VTTSQWIHPKFRGTGLAQIIVLVPRAYSLSQWQFEHEVLFAKAKLARPHVVQTYGLAHAQDGVKLIVNGQLAYQGLIFWSTSQHLAKQVEVAVTQYSATHSDDGRRSNQLPRPARLG
jgi:hypothetical protein